MAFFLNNKRFDCLIYIAAFITDNTEEKSYFVYLQTKKSNKANIKKGSRNKEHEKIGSYKENLRKGDKG